MFKTVPNNYKKNQFQRKKSADDNQYVINTGGQCSFIDGH